MTSSQGRYSFSWSYMGIQASRTLLHSVAQAHGSPAISHSWQPKKAPFGTIPARRRGGKAWKRARENLYRPGLKRAPSFLLLSPVSGEKGVFGLMATSSYKQSSSLESRKKGGLCLWSASSLCPDSFHMGGIWRRKLDPRVIGNSPVHSGLAFHSEDYLFPHSWGQGIRDLFLSRQHEPLQVCFQSQVLLWDHWGQLG
jgi:hypothetical protein